MRIASFETMAVRIPREPGPSAPREEADYVTLRLRTDDGIEGIAYAGFASPLVTKALKETVDALAAETVGADPHAVEAIGRGLARKAGGGSPAGLVTRAISAIDVALWDIRGKALGMPVWKLLGARAPERRPPTPADSSGGTTTSKHSPPQRPTLLRRASAP